MQRLCTKEVLTPLAAGRYANTADRIVNRKPVHKKVKQGIGLLWIATMGKRKMIVYLRNKKAAAIELAAVLSDQEWSGAPLIQPQ